jgi:mannose-6-phosphate isomerase-like protein (cupin superfamily)
MQAHIVHPDPQREYAFVAEGCHVLESWNDPDDPQASIARARVAAGVSTRWHALAGITERYLILSGSARVEIGDKSPEDVGPGDVVVIPPGVRQRITNNGTDELVFYAICTPRFSSERYAALE